MLRIKNSLFLVDPNYTSMKKRHFTLIAALLFNMMTGYAADPVRKPFVEITVNGKTLTAGQKAEVRTGTENHRGNPNHAATGKGS